MPIFNTSTPHWRSLYVQQDKLFARMFGKPEESMAKFALHANCIFPSIANICAKCLCNWCQVSTMHPGHITNTYVKSCKDLAQVRTKTGCLP